MSILKFLLFNWDSVLVIVVAGAVVLVLIAKKQCAILDKIVFSLVTEAENKYGSGTGAAKIAAVIEWLYPKIPAVIRLFITTAWLDKLINHALTKAKIKWKNNPDLAAYIGIKDTQ